MSIAAASTDLEILADAEMVLAAIASGRKLDSELVHRIEARSEQIRERGWGCDSNGAGNVEAWRGAVA